MKGRTGRLLLIGLIIVFLLVASRIVGFYVDLLFFQELGYEKVFLKVFSTEVLTGLIFGAVSLLFVLVNVLLVSRVQFPPVNIVFRNQMGVTLDAEALNRVSKPFG